MPAAMEPWGMIQAMTQPGPVTQLPVKVSDSKTGTVMVNSPSSSTVLGTPGGKP